jgi:hypothetical protein
MGQAGHGCSKSTLQIACGAWQSFSTLPKSTQLMMIFNAALRRQQRQQLYKATTAVMYFGLKRMLHPTFWCAPKGVPWATRPPRLLDKTMKVFFDYAQVEAYRWAQSTNAETHEVQACSHHGQLVAQALGEASGVGAKVHAQVQSAQEAHEAAENVDDAGKLGLLGHVLGHSIFIHDDKVVGLGHPRAEGGVATAEARGDACWLVARAHRWLHSGDLWAEQA